MANNAHLAETLEDGWKHIASFFAERNWPDTKLGNAASAINGRIKEIADALRGDRWIPVEERLPDDDVTVMIAIEDSSDPVWLGFLDADAWHTVDATPLGGTVTHWKPVPAGPNG